MVTEFVVNGLELVQVEVKDAADSATANTRDALLLESAPIEHARQRIVKGIRHHLVLVALALRNVDQRDRKVLADRLRDNAQPGLVVFALASRFEADLRHGLILGREVTQETLGIELLEFFERRAHERAGTVAGERFRRTIGEHAAIPALRVVLIP